MLCALYTFKRVVDVPVHSVYYFKNLPIIVLKIGQVRILDPKNYATDKLIYIESVEVCAIKDPMPADGPCVFTGKTAIYYGTAACFDDNKGHVLLPNQPMAVCDKTAGALAGLKREDIFISGSTWFYDGGGCC